MIERPMRKVEVEVVIPNGYEPMEYGQRINALCKYWDYIAEDWRVSPVSMGMIYSSSFNYYIRKIYPVKTSYPGKPINGVAAGDFYRILDEPVAPDGYEVIVVAQQHYDARVPEGAKLWIAGAWADSTCIGQRFPKGERYYAIPIVPAMPIAPPGFKLIDPKETRRSDIIPEGSKVWSSIEQNWTHTIYVGQSYRSCELVYAIPLKEIPVAPEGYHLIASIEQPVGMMIPRGTKVWLPHIRKWIGSSFVGRRYDRTEEAYYALPNNPDSLEKLVRDMLRHNVPHFVERARAILGD